MSTPLPLGLTHFIERCVDECRPKKSNVHGIQVNPNRFSCLLTTSFSKMGKPRNIYNYVLYSYRLLTFPLSFVIFPGPPCLSPSSSPKPLRRRRRRGPGTCHLWCVVFEFTTLIPGDHTSRPSCTTWVTDTRPLGDVTSSFGGRSERRRLPLKTQTPNHLTSRLSKMPYTHNRSRSATLRTPGASSSRRPRSHDPCVTFPRESCKTFPKRVGVPLPLDGLVLPRTRKPVKYFRAFIEGSTPTVSRDRRKKRRSGDEPHPNSSRPSTMIPVRGTVLRSEERTERLDTDPSGIHLTETGDWRTELLPGLLRPTSYV